VTEIGYSFLSGCVGLTRFELPNSVTKIGSNFLSGCTGLDFLKLSSSLVVVPDGFLSHLKNTEIQLILDRFDGVYFGNPSEILQMSEDQQKNCLQTKGGGHIIWNGEEITPEEIYKKGHIVNFTVPDTCVLYLLPKKPKKACYW
jgi:hypothetical protein